MFSSKRLIILLFVLAGSLWGQQNTPLDSFVPTTVRFHGPPPATIPCLQHQLAFDEVSGNVYYCSSQGLYAAIAANGSGGGPGITITTVSGLSSVPNKTNGTIAVVVNGNSLTDCTTGGGSFLVNCQFNGITWSQINSTSVNPLPTLCGDTSHGLGWNGTTFTCQSITGSAQAGGANGQLQWNSAGALGGISAFSSNGTTTINATAGGILDLHLGTNFFFPGNLPTGLVTATTVTGATSTVAAPVGVVVGTTDTQALTNKNLTGAGNTFPTFNQNTTGSAAKWTTPRLLAGNSVDGSANVPFANSFIVQGTTDAGLSGAQFLGALGTGPVKNTTTTGVLSIAAAADIYGLWSGTCNATTFLRGDGSCQASGSGTLNAAPQFSIPYYSAAGTTNTISGLIPPVTNGIWYPIQNVIANAAVATTLAKAGVPYNPQTGTSYTIGSANTWSDRATLLTFSNALAVAATLPQANSTGFDQNWVDHTCNIGAGTVTITPTISNISYTAGNSWISAATSMPLLTGQCAWIYSDNTNYFAVEQGIGIQSITFSAPFTGGTITTTGSAGCPTCVTSSSPGAGIAHFAGSTQTVTSSAVALSDIATQAADTLDMNASGSTASPTAVSLAGLGGTNSCGGASNALTYNTSTHAFGCNTLGGSGTVTVVGGGANALGNNQIVTGGTGQTVQTICTTCTLDSSGNLIVAAGGSLSSADTGTPKFTFGTNSVSLSQPLTVAKLTNQFVTGTTTNLTTHNFPASSGAVTLTYPNTTTNILGGNSDTTTTHVLHATATGGIGSFSAIAVGDLPSAIPIGNVGSSGLSGTSPVAISAAGVISLSGAAGQVPNGASGAFTATPTLGASGTVGTIAFGNATSGTVTLGTVTGALGSVTASLPANTGTIAELNLGQTWSAAQTFGAITVSSCTGCGGGGAPTWDSITNAAGNLTLANGTNTTTFNQTSGAAWTWANTTAATVTTPQNSPIFNLNGTAWVGAGASGSDGWTIQDVPAVGLNGNSVLTFGHTGTTTGHIQIGLPNSHKITADNGALSLVAASGSATQFLSGSDIVFSGSNSSNAITAQFGDVSSGTALTAELQTSAAGQKIAFTSMLKATAALTSGQVVKIDTANDNSVVVAATTDTTAVMGFVVGSPGAGALANIAQSGSILLDPLLGTGTCARGQFVINDTTTSGRVQCTNTYTAGTVLGYAIKAQLTVGNAVSVYVQYK